MRIADFTLPPAGKSSTLVKLLSPSKITRSPAHKKKSIILSDSFLRQSRRGSDLSSPRNKLGMRRKRYHFLSDSSAHESTPSPKKRCFPDETMTNPNPAPPRQAVCTDVALTCEGTSATRTSTPKSNPNPGTVISGIINMSPIHSQSPQRKKFSHVRDLLKDLKEARMPPGKKTA